MNRPLRVVVAGGGTGGHLFPGIALAEAFCRANPATRVVFAGTGNRLEKAILGATPFTHRTIAAGGLKGRNWWRRITAGARTVRGLFQALALLQRLRADLVVGVGGYVSGPMVLAAWLLRVPAVVQEQNARPGLTNRLLAPLVRRIYVAFPDARWGRWAPKVRQTGNPIREGLLGAAPVKKKPGMVTVLVCGGSQGARRINAAMGEALPYLPLERMRFVHQTGAADEAAVCSAYAAVGAESRVQAFFYDMGAQYAAADLVVCRAGATTVAELTALGKPAIFIPYPHAADDHQRHNARILAEQGAGEMIVEEALDGKKLAGRIRCCLEDPHRLSAMAAAARRLGRPDAADVVVADCYRLLGAVPGGTTDGRDV